MINKLKKLVFILYLISQITTNAYCIEHKKKECGFAHVPLTSKISKRIGFGALQLSYPEMMIDEASSLLKLAVKNNIQLFDTAAVYGANGHNERLLGAILATEDGIIISTKCGIDFTTNKYTQTPSEIYASAKNSLQNLQRPKIDLLYLHRINPDASDQEFEETIKALKQLVVEGLVDYIGLSEPTKDELLKAINIVPEIPISAVQSAYSLFTRRAESNGVLQTCKENNILFVGYTSVLRGLSDYKLNEITNHDLNYLKPHELRKKVFRILNVNTVNQTVGWFAEEYIHNNIKLAKQFLQESKRLGITPAQLNLAWSIANGVLPIPGTTKKAHLIENINAYNINLSEKDLIRLSEMFPEGAFKGIPNPQIFSTFNNDDKLESKR